MSFYKIEMPNNQEPITVYELLLKNHACENSILTITNAKAFVTLKDEFRNPINLMDYEIYLHRDDDNQANGSSTLCQIANTKQGVLEFDLNQAFKQNTKGCLMLHLCHAQRQPYCIQLSINPLVNA